MTEKRTFREAVERAPDTAADTYPTPEHGWVCYHCGEHFPGTFAGSRRARDHFGWKPNSVAACQIEKGDLRRLRAVEDERDRLTAEIARLKAELEEARVAAERLWGVECERNEYRAKSERLERERDEARAVAGAMREALEKIGGLAGSCVIQRAPSDDNIIADHIEEIRDIAGAASAKARGVL